MRRYKSHIAILISTLVLITLFTVPIFNPLISRLLHPFNGSFGSLRVAFLEGFIELDGLEGEVKVYYDRIGVPHVYAENALDMYKVMGFLHAKDRFFQMDVMRRLAQGRLSELFGDLTINIDRDFRHVNLYGAAVKTLNYIIESGEFTWEYQVLEAYTEGVNSFLEYIEKSGFTLTEYALLGVKPEKWRPVDSVSIGKFMAWSLSWSMEDLRLQELVNRNGLEILIDLKLLERPLNTPILESFIVGVDGEVNFSATEKSDFQELPVKNILSRFSELDALSTLFSEIYGSNNWVVSGELTRDGYPIVANDPHLSLTAPPIWYYISLNLVGNLSILGASLPGTPVVLLGRNNYVAWGFTNVGPDVTDFYYFVWDGDKYYFNGSWRVVSERVEEIRVLDGDTYKTIEYVVNETVLGPIYEYGGERYAMRWTGSGVTLELVAVLRYNYAKDVYELIDAARYFHVAPQNLVAADVKGNIMYYPAGLYPVRNASFLGEIRDTMLFNLGFLPYNASNGEGVWIGYIPFEDIPHTVNPDDGFIVTANNKVVGKYPFYLGWSWADRYRYERIRDLLLEKAGELTVEDMMSIQVDLTSYAAKSIVPYAIEIIKEEPFEEPYREAFKLISQWDYTMDSDRPEPPLYVLWIYNIHKGLWKDILGDLSVRLIPLETTEDVLKSFVSGSVGVYKEWIPEVRSVVYEAFKEAVDKLTSVSGPIESWRWGDLIKYEITHFLGDVLPWFNYIVYDGQGGFYTVFPAGFSLGDPPYRISSSQSMRSIYVLDGGRPQIFFALPGGNIGNVFSPHYEDLLDEYVEMGYLQLVAYEDPEELSYESKLVFGGG